MHADIFFFVTTVAVVVVALALTIVLVYLAKVLSDIKSITEQVREEAILFRGDINKLRSEMRDDGFRVERLFSFFRGFMKRKSSGSKLNNKTKK